jgi:hypothetical protein
VPRRAAAILIVVSMSTGGTANSQELSLTGDQLGCTSARGDYVAFLVPEEGIVLLASRSFPGGSRVGTVGGGRLEANVPGYGPVRLTVETGVEATIWGMLDRSLDVGEQRGCISFGGFRWSSVDDLKTYLHWGVREVLANIPYDLQSGQAPPSIELGSRRITLELLAPDGQRLRIESVEGSTAGYRPRDADSTFFFQPFFLGPERMQAAVRVSMKRGEFFGPGVTEEVAFVVIGTDEATVLSTTPAIGLRLAGVEDRVTFVN